VVNNEHHGGINQHEEQKLKTFWEDTMNKLKAYGYARVSTHGQDLDLQLKQIKDYAVFRGIGLIGIFQDKASGKNTDRADFQRLLKTLEVNPEQINALIITKLDRMGRSLLDLINTTKWLDEKQIGLISITNSIDTTTKEGRLFFYIMGALGEYERELIIERTTAGREEAILKGVKMGAPRKNINTNEVKRMIAEGIPKTVIAQRMKCDRKLIYKRLEEVTKE
jgi:DNA invertase Pin-like site-specific DNA recombinase